MAWGFIYWCFDFEIKYIVEGISTYKVVIIFFVMETLGVGEYIRWHNHTGGPYFRLYYSGIFTGSEFALTLCEEDKSILLHFPLDEREISIKDDEGGKRFNVRGVTSKTINLEEIAR